MGGYVGHSDLAGLRITAVLVFKLAFLQSAVSNRDAVRHTY